ncbi:hypothetical protein B0H16DRAFT_1479117 [Mycena metata]|uniref:Uncharacterized protein n=1 Tax=Mycena metata TaxID=1033252 RepID=A0AAD7MDY7_9AGAR|nr:hypothetical protein B0H16DRAFT_1479117 [Mycena metata]
MVENFFRWSSLATRNPPTLLVIHFPVFFVLILRTVLDVHFDLYFPREDSRLQQASALFAILHLPGRNSFLDSPSSLRKGLRVWTAELRFPLSPIPTVYSDFVLRIAVLTSRWGLITVFFKLHPNFADSCLGLLITLLSRLSAGSYDYRLRRSNSSSSNALIFYQFHTTYGLQIRQIIWLPAASSNNLATGSQQQSALGPMPAVADLGVRVGCPNALNLGASTSAVITKFY